MVIAVGETRNARAFDYRCLHESAGGRVVRSDARVSMEERGREEGDREETTYVSSSTRGRRIYNGITFPRLYFGSKNAVSVPISSLPFSSIRTSMLFCETNAGLGALLCAFGLTAFQFVRIRLPFPASFLSFLLFSSAPATPSSLSPASLAPSPFISPVPRLSLSSAPSNASRSLLHPDISYRTSNRSPRRMSLTHRTGVLGAIRLLGLPPNSRIDPPVSGVEGWRTVRSVDHGAIVRYPLSLPPNGTERRWFL